MAVVVTAEAQTEYKVAITVTGMVSPYAWEMFRIVDGVRTRVRGPGWVGETVVIDREAPLNVNVVYVVVWYELVLAVLTQHETFSTFVILPALLPVLGDPITGEYVETTIRDWPEYQRSNRASVIPVPGEDYPIVVTDRLGTALSTVTLVTTTPAGRVAMRELLLRGRTVLLRPACTGVDDESTYLTVLTMKSTRKTNNNADPVRLWALDIAHSAPPSPLIAATGKTLQDLYDAYPTPLTLNDLWIAFPGTLLDIADADL